MTPDDVKGWLDRIRGLADYDDEDAHRVEDNMRRELLEAIAAGTCSDPVECARLALTSRDIEFSRWYA